MTDELLSMSYDDYNILKVSRKSKEKLDRQMDRTHYYSPLLAKLGDQKRDKIS